MTILTNPFSLDTARLPIDRIVDRERQIDFLRERVIDRGENVLVTGPFGIGKTCLLRKFRGTLLKEVADHTLIIEMEMRRVSADPSDFLGDLLLKLVSVFWEQVLLRPYSELIKAVTNPSDVRELVMPQVRAVLELYRLLRPESVTADLEEQNIVGLDKILKATKQERVSRGIVRGELRPSEFVSLASEILSALQEKGIDRVIIFGDEANHIDPDIETDIIRRNFEVFGRKNVQFVLTAKADILQQAPRLREAFPAWLDVRPFEDPEVLDQLLSVYSANGSVPSFAPRCRDMIWKISGGNPREIQRLCQECAARAVQRGKAGRVAEVDLDLLLEAIVQLYELRPR